MRSTSQYALPPGGRVHTASTSGGGASSSHVAAGFGRLGTSSSLPVLTGVSDTISEMAQQLSERTPKTRQRVFAAHAHDTQLLQQMVSVLTARAARPQGRDRGISQAGLVEEGQLYAVCLQQVAAQMSVHSPSLSEISGQLVRPLCDGGRHIRACCQLCFRRLLLLSAAH